MCTKIPMKSITMYGVHCNLGYILWVVVIFCLWLQLIFGFHLVMMIQNFVIILDPYSIIYILCEIMWFFVCHNDLKISYYTTILTFLLSVLFMNPLKKPKEHLILQCDLPSMGGGFKNWRANRVVIVRNCCIRWEILMVCRQYGCHNIYLLWVF